MNQPSAACLLGHWPVASDVKAVAVVEGKVVRRLAVTCRRRKPSASRESTRAMPSPSAATRTRWSAGPIIPAIFSAPLVSGRVPEPTTAAVAFARSTRLRMSAEGLSRRPERNSCSSLSASLMDPSPSPSASILSHRETFAQAIRRGDVGSRKGHYPTHASTPLDTGLRRYDGCGKSRQGRGGSKERSLHTMCREG